MDIFCFDFVIIDFFRMSFAYSLFHNSVGLSVGRSFCSGSWNWFLTMTASLMRMLIVNYSLHRASNWTQLDSHTGCTTPYDQIYRIPYCLAKCFDVSKKALSFAFHWILTGQKRSMLNSKLFINFWNFFRFRTFSNISCWSIIFNVFQLPEKSNESEKKLNS